MAKRSASCTLEEEEKQTAKMPRPSSSSASEVADTTTKVSPLFASGVSNDLVKIVNQLDPFSFSKFSRTCKAMHTFCYNTRGIRIPFGRYDKTYGNNQFYCNINVVCYTGSKATITFYSGRGGHYHLHGTHEMWEKERNLLEKPPFDVTILELKFFSRYGQKVNSRIIEWVSQYLRRFHSIHLGHVYTDEIGDWNAFAHFIEEFGAKSMNIAENWGRFDLPSELLPIFMNKVERLRYFPPVADDVILSATSDQLCLPQARISPETFKELLKKFRDGEFSYRYIGNNSRAVDFNKNPFFEACLEVMDIVVYSEEIDVSKMKPSVMYRNPRDDRPLFRFLKSDGSIGEMRIRAGSVLLGDGNEFGGLHIPVDYRML